MTFKLLTEQHLEFVSYTGLSESTHVKMPHCRKLHVAAQYISLFIFFLSSLLLLLLFIYLFIFISFSTFLAHETKVLNALMY